MSGCWEVDMVINTVVQYCCWWQWKREFHTSLQVSSFRISGADGDFGILKIVCAPALFPGQRGSCVLCVASDIESDMWIDIFWFWFALVTHYVQRTVVKERFITSWCSTFTTDLQVEPSRALCCILKFRTFSHLSFVSFQIRSINERVRTVNQSSRSKQVYLFGSKSE